MKKYIAIIATAIAAVFVSGCAKAPEYDFIHDDCTIHAVYCTPLNCEVSTQVSAIIDHEAGTVEIAIPHDKYQKYYDLSKLKIRANLGYDAKLTPSLSSQVWDLSEHDLEVTVTATMTGNSKKYVISAYKKK